MARIKTPPGMEETYRAIEKDRMDVTDCRDCAFKHDHIGHGECWAECNHTLNGRDLYDDILWGCGEEFRAVPKWCPLDWSK